MRPFTSTPTVADDSLASSDDPRHVVSLSAALREQAAHTWYRVQRCGEGTNRPNGPARYDSRQDEAGATVTTAAHARPAAGGQARVLGVVCAAIFLSALNGSIVNVVLPVIGQELVVEPAVLGWVVTAYSNMLFFLGGSLGETLTTAMLSARAAATDAINLLHDGAGVGFSDAFLLLMVPVILALALTAAVPGRVGREPLEATPAAASTAPVAEPGDSS